jgi:NADPH:quinone reductase-like Zn-dependent oxidoreductase
MKAIVFTEHGSPDVLPLKDVPKPTRNRPLPASALT